MNYRILVARQEMIQYMNYNFEQGQVMCMSRLEETVNDADFIFEAVKEDMEIKKDLLESKYQQC